MPTTAEFSRKAQEQRERVRTALRPFMENGKPKMATKEELWSEAKQEFGVSRASFDYGTKRRRRLRLLIRPRPLPLKRISNPHESRGRGS